MDFMIDQKFKETLKRAGYKLTAERAEIFRLISKSHTPLSPVELSKLTEGRMAESTVYRNIDILEEIGTISRVYTGWKFRLELSDLFRGHHHHMLCQNCGGIINFEETPAFLRELEKISKDNGFSLSSHVLELAGLCKNCRSITSAYA
ncbi:transcriptional repressor [Candidatus Saccharibacteria bacterium]|nr:transcriptional repressor [Candidatus Saccharibacteria bacterium]